MVKSMTGYGKATGLVNKKKVHVEIKSLNSKHLDANLRIPSIYREKELDLRNYLQHKLSRGKVDFSLFVEIPNELKAQSINKEAVLNYYNQLKDIAYAADIKASESILNLAVKMPDTLDSEREELDENEWTEIFVIINEAIDKLNNFRNQEGDALKTELSTRINNILTYLSEVEPYESERVEKVKSRIQKNLQEVVNKTDVDDNRLEQEMIFYIEKLDVTEEKVRLKGHCDYFFEVLEKEEHQGKKLGFIAQEIGREINTLGSKANHQEIQKLVVQMKDELEKLKEQILNTL